MTEPELDQILALQIAVARLGEKPFSFWWNSDVADVDGGADLLVRLLGKEIAPLAAIEGVLLVAKQTEKRLLSAIPGPPAYSLFCPEPSQRTALRNRFRHFKTYPEELPERLGFLVGPECSESDLLSTIDTAIATVANGSIEMQDTSFGVELQQNRAAAMPLESKQLAAMLASTAVRSPKGSYTLPYYREDAGA